jgi:hypothetical protein
MYAIIKSHVWTNVMHYENFYCTQLPVKTEMVLMIDPCLGFFFNLQFEDYWSTNDNDRRIPTKFQVALFSCERPRALQFEA